LIKIVHKRILDSFSKAVEGSSSRIEWLVEHIPYAPKSANLSHHKIIRKKLSYQHKIFGTIYPKKPVTGTP